MMRSILRSTRCGVLCALVGAAAHTLGAQRAGTTGTTGTASATGAAQPPGKLPGPPPLPKTPMVPTSHEGIFAQRDVRAVEAIGYLRCIERTVGAMRAGTMGTLPELWELACVHVDTEWRGVYAEITATGAGAAVRAQYALRTDGRSGVVQDAIDTTLVGAVLRAQRRALSVPLPGRGTTPFVPVILPQNTFMEIYFLPSPLANGRVTVGGDSIIQMSKDGIRELGHSRASPALRTLDGPPPRSRTVTLTSSEERVPLVSELFAARELLSVVPEVRVRTKSHESVITRVRGTWVHTLLPGARAP